jgi:serine/threonine-protein kinase
MGAEQQCPRIVGHYDLLEKVGEGGMGTVYRAHDRLLDRTVALKFLHEKVFESSRARQRFLQEARAVSRLSHPHIAVIHSIEESDGETFLVFEYLAGGTLRGVLESLRARGSRMPIEQAVNYGLQIAEALADAHANGIIHRDIKPSNIMLSRDGSLKVVDFGLSKWLHHSETETTAGRVVGSPFYMSPEQARGARVDERSDIFSLGVVLYEMIVGQLPFSADRWEAVIHQILHEPAPPLSKARPDTPSELAAIVHRALERSPEVRFRRMVDLVTELRVFLRQPLAESQLPTGTMVASQPARRRLLAGAAVLVAALVVVVSPIRTKLGLSLPEEKRVAMLPFGSATTDSASQAFDDGLMQSAVAALRHFRADVVVTPASEIRRLAINTPEAARKFAGANLVITGKVRKNGKKIDVEIALFNPAKSGPIASTRIEHDLERSGAIQEKTASALAKLLRLKDDGTTLAAGSRVADANEAYLEGSGYLQRFDMPGNRDKAIALLEEATRKDPSFGDAYVALSDAYRRRYRDTKDVQFLDRARDSAAKALSLNGSSANAHAAVAVVLSLGGDQDGAIREFQRALSLDPGGVDALRDLAAAYDAAGRIPDAEASYRKAVGLRPNDWVTLADLGAFHYKHQKYAEANNDFLNVIRLVPDSPLQHRNLGGVYIAIGRFADAEQELLHSIQLGPTVPAYSNLGALYIYFGRYRDAIGALQKATQMSAAQIATNYPLWGNLGDAYRYTPGYASKAPGAYQAAIQMIEQQLTFDPDNPQLLADLAVYAAKAGDRSLALDMIGRAMRFAKGNRKVSFQAALVYELDGARVRALTALEDAVRGGYSLDEITREPALAKLRQDPRYQHLISSRTAK